MRGSCSLTGWLQMPHSGYASGRGCGCPLGNMIARYFSAMVLPSAEGAVVCAGASGVAETNCMGFFQSPRPYAGCCTKGTVEMSVSSKRGSASSSSSSL